MDNLVRELEKIPLTGDDLVIQSRKMGNPNVGWMTYDSLRRFSKVDDIFSGNKNTIFILLQIKNQGDTNEVGHWVSLSFDHDNRLQYYDPYGLSIEQDISATGESDLLLRLIKNSPSHSNINVNKNQHQAMRNEVNVCGRHTVIRSLFHYLNNDQYNANVISPLVRSKQIKDPDVLVALMTSFLTKADDVARHFFVNKPPSFGRQPTPQAKFIGNALPPNNIGMGGRVV